MKEVIERLNWLAYKCEDKAITPDVKDDVKYALEEIERLNNIINETSEKLQKIIDEVNNKTLINVGQFAIRLEAIQDELVGGSESNE